MKRNVVGKSKSFQMRRSSSNVGRQQQRDRSLDRRILRSYEEMNQCTGSSHSDSKLHDLHLSDDSDSDDDNGNGSGSSKRLMTQEPDESESRYEDLAQWAMGLPNLLFSASASSGGSGTPSKCTFKTPPRTRSKFKPSYLLQRRKEGLVQHQHADPTSYLPGQPASRKHSIWALLVLLTACYLLMSLTKSGGTNLVQPSLSSDKPTLYYLNLKEERPLQIVTKMLTMHAFAYQQQIPSKFAGVCGYPTYQQDSQRQAIHLLVQMGLQDILQFDVCPPIEAILHHDPQYKLLEEQDMPTSSGTNYVANPAWQATIAAQTKPTTRDPAELWRKVLTIAAADAAPAPPPPPPLPANANNNSEPRRRLRGLENLK